MTHSAPTSASLERELEKRYQARLDREVEKLRAQSHLAVEEFKRSFPPPSDDQIEQLLYPELSEFAVEIGGKSFTLHELPALAERKFLRLVEQKLPALLAEVMAFDERLGDDAEQGFARVLARAGSAIDLIADACVLVLDPAGEHVLSREFIQEHASTARQIRILKAQLLLNGARDFLSRLFPALKDPTRVGGEKSSPVPDPVGAAASFLTPGSPPLSVGSSSSGDHRPKLEDSLPWDNSL